MHWSSGFRLIDNDYIFSKHAVSLRSKLFHQDKYCAMIYVILNYISHKFKMWKFQYADTQQHDGKQSDCSFDKKI